MSTFVSPMTKDEDKLYAEINKLHRRFHKYKNWCLLKVKKTRSFSDFQKYGRFYVFNTKYNSVSYSDINLDIYLEKLEKYYE